MLDFHALAFHFRNEKYEISEKRQDKKANKKNLKKARIAINKKRKGRKKLKRTFRGKSIEDYI